jgi:hypothetical protein
MDCAQECVLQHLHVHCIFFSARDENGAAVAEVAEHQAFEHVDENRFSQPYALKLLKQSDVFFIEQFPQTSLNKKRQVQALFCK